MKRNCVRVCGIALAMLTVMSSCGSRAYKGGGGGGWGGYSPSSDQITNPYQRAKKYKPAYAAENQCGDNAFWSYDGEAGVLSISGTGDLWDYRLPETEIKGEVNYVQSDAPWFDAIYGGKSSLKKIIVGEGITHIGDCAFYTNDYFGCDEIALPSTLVSIGDRSFSRFTMSKMVLPQSLQYIGEMAFGYSYIESLSLPEAVEYIGDYAFYGCGGITNFVIGPNVRYFGKGAIGYCRSLSNVTVSEMNGGFVMSGGMLFDSTMTKLLWYSPVKGRRSVSIPAGVTEIGEYAFSGCKLTSIALPTGLKIIGKGAFADNKFNNFTVPEGTVSIGDSAFSGCNNIVKIVIPDSVMQIGKNAFFGVKGVEISERNMNYTAVDGVVYDKNMTKIIELVNPPAEYRIPDTVTMVQDGLFYDNDFDKIIIPKTLAAFASAEQCKADEFVYEGSFEDWCRTGCYFYAKKYTFLEPDTDDGSIVGEADDSKMFRWKYKNGTIRIMGFGSTESVTGEWLPGNENYVSDIVIMEGITGIGSGLFKECNKFETITLPTSLESINANTFAGCEELKSILIPENVYYIGDDNEGAFTGCSSLERIDVDPSNVWFTGVNGVLYSKEMGTLIYFPPAYMGQRFVVPETVTVLNALSFESSKLTEIDLSLAEITKIGEQAFKNCANLQTIKFGGTRNEWDKLAADAGVPDGVEIVCEE